MLNPEITPETEETLYNDAQNIYSTYLDPDSADFLNLPMYISNGMKQSNRASLYNITIDSSHKTNQLFIFSQKF